MPAPLWNAVESLLTAATRTGTIRSYAPEWTAAATDQTPPQVEVQFVSFDAADAQQLTAELRAFGFHEVTQEGSCVTYTFRDATPTHDTPAAADGGPNVDESVFDAIANDPLLDDRGETRLDPP